MDARNDRRPIAETSFKLRRPPLLFELSRLMIRLGVRGGYRLWLHLLRSGKLDQIAFYSLGGRVREAPLLAPLYREESSWSEIEVATYERKLVAAAIRRIEKFELPIALIDCGADIGMFASAIARNCAGLESILAFEPNIEAFALLRASFDHWPISARAINAAVGDTKTRGRLTGAPGASAHALFVVEDALGPIEIRPIDDEVFPPGHLIALKIDIEGGEYAAVLGAMRTLKGATAFVVMFEAHPKVVERTGVDPVETIRLIQSAAPIDIEVAEFPHVKIDTAIPFFEQLGPNRATICNIICSSRRPA